MAGVLDHGAAEQRDLHEPDPVGQVTASTLTLLALSLAIDRPWLLPVPNAKTWAAVVALAFLCTAMA